MKNYFIAAALLVSTMGVAQQRDTTQAPGGRAGMPGMAGMAGMAGLGGARQAPKPYKEVITAKAVSQKGLFTVHKVITFSVKSANPNALCSAQYSLSNSIIIRLPPNLNSDGMVILFAI